MVSDPNFHSITSHSNGRLLPAESPRFKFELPKSAEDSVNFSKLLSILHRRWLWLVVTGLLVSAGIWTRVLLQEPRYNSSFRLLVGSPTGENRYLNFDQDGQLTSQSGEENLDYATQIQVLFSPKVLTPILDKISEQVPNFDYGNFFQYLKVYRLGDTKILEVTYQDADPQTVKTVLDELAAGYVEYSRDQQQNSLNQGLKFTQEQLPVLQERVDKLQEKLQRFRQKNDLIEPEIKAESLSELLNGVIEQKQETDTQLRETELLSRRLQEQLGLGLEQAMEVAALSEAPRYQALLTQLQEVETQLALESARFTEGSPLVSRLYEQRQNLLPLLNREASSVLGDSSVADIQTLAASTNPIRLQLTQDLIEVANQRQVLLTRLQSLAVVENQFRQQLKEMALLVRQYTDLQRELQVANDSLNHFLNAQDTLQIEASQQTSSWQLLADPKLPGAPFAPNRPRGWLIGGIAGIMAGVGAALLAEKLDRRFHSPEDIQELARLPVVGRIPFEQGLKSPRDGAETSLTLTSNPENNSALLDAFRSLHANLYMLNPDRQLRSLVISSPVPEEGKSTTAVCLAQASAAMGQKVLLVDADLRRPRIHTMTDLPNVWGLSDLIAGDLDPHDVIQQSPLEDNLHILTAGQNPPDPTRLLSSQKMRKLMEELQTSFELVIFDTPPLLGLVDAKLIVPQTDGLALVVSLARSDRSALAQVLEGINMSHLSVLGIIANRVKYYANQYPEYYQRYYTKTKESDQQGTAKQIKQPKSS